MKSLKFFCFCLIISFIVIELAAQTVCYQERYTYEIIVTSQELTTIDGTITLSKGYTKEVSEEELKKLDEPESD